MAKGMMVNHVCDCGHRQNISKITMARRNGTRCSRCGRNMQPTEAGWETLSMANSAKLGYREPEKKVAPKKIVPPHVRDEIDDAYEEERRAEMEMEYRMLHGCDD